MRFLRVTDISDDAVSSEKGEPLARLGDTFDIDVEENEQ